MSCLGAVAVVALSATACPGGSYWQTLEAVRTLEAFCPAEVAKPMGGPMGARFDAAIAAARTREMAFAAARRQALSPAQMEAEFAAHEARMRVQVAEGFKTLGCPALAQRLGLGAAGLLVTPETALEVARTIQLPSTTRPDDIPERDRTGTTMDYALQGVLKTVLQRQHTCDPVSFRAAPVSQQERTPPDAPPYVKPILDITELWTGTCKGAPATFKIQFLQDQRKWLSYKIESLPPQAPAKP